LSVFQPFGRWPKILRAERGKRQYNLPISFEFKTVLNKIIYRIEAKPGGGFVATCKDPSVPSLEGATRAEVQQKIQAAIQRNLASQFPAIKDVLAGSQVNLHYHVEAKPGGGFIIQHGDAAHEPADDSMRSHIEDMIESKILSTIMEKLPPELHHQITEKLNSGGLEVEVNRKVKVISRHGGLLSPVFGTNPDKLPGTVTDPASPIRITTTSTASGEILSASSTDIQNAGEPRSLADVNQSPITRYEKSSGGTLFRFLIIVAIIGLLIFLYLHRP